MNRLAEKLFLVWMVLVRQITDHEHSHYIHMVFMLVMFIHNIILICNIRCIDIRISTCIYLYTLYTKLKTICLSACLSFYILGMTELTPCYLYQSMLDLLKMKATCFKVCIITILLVKLFWHENTY